MSLRVKTETGDIIVADVGGGGGGASTAEEVSYDNTASGLIADNVQSAIDVMKDEFHAEMNDVNTSIAGCVKTPNTTAATIGQLLSVEAVSGGKPTSWKVVTSVPVANGGTGATSAADARTNLGLGSAATKSTTSSITGSTNLPTDTAVKTYVDNAVGGKITAPQTATVGQILSVKAVDEDGKPTEWETVDKPEGGGGITIDKLGYYDQLYSSTPISNLDQYKMVLITANLSPNNTWYSSVILPVPTSGTAYSNLCYVDTRGQYTSSLVSVTKTDISFKVYTYDIAIYGIK